MSDPIILPATTPVILDRADPAKSDHISRVRAAVKQVQDGMDEMVRLGLIRVDRGYNPDGSNPIAQLDFEGKNAFLAVQDFFAALLVFGALAGVYTESEVLRAAFNRIREE